MMILAERLMVVDVTRVYIYVYPSMYPDIYEFPITSFCNLRVILRATEAIFIKN